MSDANFELIKHAAVKAMNGQVMMGKNHADCFHKGAGIGLDMSSKRDDQGFITSKGRYVDRIEGAKIAFKCKQIEKPTKILFSEDLWCEKYSAKHDYCEIKGYILKTEDQ